MKRIVVGISLLCAVLLVSCGNSSNEKTNTMPGRAVFEKYNCGLCHGENGEGKPNAPALRDLKANWQKANLIEYLKHPTEYAKNDERLKTKGTDFPTMMPDYDYISDGDLSILADYLMALE